MKKAAIILTVIFGAMLLALISVKPVISANRELPFLVAIEYKIVTDLGKHAADSKIDKALDSFSEQPKGKATLESDLKKLGG